MSTTKSNRATKSKALDDLTPALKERFTPFFNLYPMTSEVPHFHSITSGNHESYKWATPDAEAEFINAGTGFCWCYGAFFDQPNGTKFYYTKLSPNVVDIDARFAPLERFAKHSLRIEYSSDWKSVSIRLSNGSSWFSPSRLKAGLRSLLDRSDEEISSYIDQFRWCRP